MSSQNDRIRPSPIATAVQESVPGSQLAATSLAINSEYMDSATSLDPVLQVDKEDQSPDPNSIIKLSKKRWLVLFTMGVFGLSMAVAYDTSPILSLILELLELREDQYLYVSQIFSYVGAVTSIPTAWYVDKFGIKRSLYTGSILFVFGCLLKAALYSPSLSGWQEYKMFYYFVSGFLGTQTAALFFMLPLKVSETWFSFKERSVAWTIMISTAELGVCFASLIYPRIMKTVEQIQILAYINLGALAITGVVCMTCISSDAPKHPPSERQAKANREKDVPFKTAIKRIVTNKEIMLHLVHLGIFESCIITVSSVFQKILTNAGHSTIFAGNLMSINAFVSIIMLIFMSSFVHKVTNAILMSKLSSAVQAILQIIYLVVMILRLPGWILIAVSIVVTICKCWATPNFTNVTAELAAGNVSQATIVGFSISQTVVLMTVINMTFASLIDFHGEGRDQVSDYTRALVFVCIVNAINEVIYQLFFHGRYVKEQTDETTTNHAHLNVENNSHLD